MYVCILHTHEHILLKKFHWQRFFDRTSRQLRRVVPTWGPAACRGGDRAGQSGLLVSRFDFRVLRGEVDIVEILLWIGVRM